MIITFDLNGVDRKILVREISEITGKKAEYQFMPTCAYIIGSYTVNKDGTVSTGNTDRTTLDTLIAALDDRGFAKVSEEAEATEQEELVLDTEKTENDRFSISMSRDFFDDSTLSKLDRTIASKSELFKMAFKTDDLSYEVTEDRVKFSWFPFTGEDGEGLAYCNFIDLLCKSIKEHKRVNASRTQTENPKFAMRVYLIRLGMVGDEFKQTRKILLRYLDGSSAFRKQEAGFPSRKIIEALKVEYPVGARVELLQMNDAFAPPIGTKGTVRGIDDAGSILVDWDNGSRLNVAYGEDKVRKLDSVRITCYGETEVWDDRKEATEFFLEAMNGSDGSERDRYAQIYAQLVSGKTVCTDKTD